MASEDLRPTGENDSDQVPRRGFLAALPKRSLMRILILLGALVGIIYLRDRTSSIAGCMSDAFRLPAATFTETRGTAVRARIELPVDASPRPLR